MIELAIFLLFVALTLLVSLLSGDYSFDGICRTLNYYYLRSAMAMGDFIYIFAVSFGLDSVGYQVSPKSQFIVVLALLLFRLIYILMFERKLILSQRQVWLLWLVSPFFVLVNLFFGPALVILLALLLAVALRLSTTPNCYQEDTFRSLVLLYAKDYRHEISYIESLKISKNFRRALKAIMISEAINRPRIFRYLERVLFFTGAVKTSGLMQASSTGKVDNLVSINDAVAFLSGTNDVTVASYAKRYNGNVYSQLVVEVDFILSKYDKVYV